MPNTCLTVQQAPEREAFLAWLGGYRESGELARRTKLPIDSSLKLNRQISFVIHWF